LGALFEERGAGRKERGEELGERGGKGRGKGKGGSWGADELNCWWAGGLIS
jgi:hypothetical protein